MALNLTAVRKHEANGAEMMKLTLGGRVYLPVGGNCEVVIFARMTFLRPMLKLCHATWFEDWGYTMPTSRTLDG